MSQHRGVYQKFIVQRVDGRDAPGSKHEACALFVLDLDHDPFAIPALTAYANACETQFPEMAADLRNKIQKLMSA